LTDHPKVKQVYFPGLLDSEDQRKIYEKQCTGPGGMIAFELADADEKQAFEFLDSIKLIKLAVSLGGTESLVEHPATMTHADVPSNEQLEIGITPALIRLSVGIEHPEDLIKSLEFALEQVSERQGVETPDLEGVTKP
jgi:methionine-gamma-lyase